MTIDELFGRGAKRRLVKQEGDSRLRRCLLAIEKLGVAKERWFTLGMGSRAKLQAVSHTYTATGPASARVGIISAREATRAERRQYENEPR